MSKFIRSDCEEESCNKIITNQGPHTSSGLGSRANHATPTSPAGGFGKFDHVVLATWGITRLSLGYQKAKLIYFFVD